MIWYNIIYIHISAKRICSDRIYQKFGISVFRWIICCGSCNNWSHNNVVIRRWCRCASVRQPLFDSCKTRALRNSKTWRKSTQQGALSPPCCRTELWSPLEIPMEAWKLSRKHLNLMGFPCSQEAILLWPCAGGDCTAVQEQLKDVRSVASTESCWVDSLGRKVEEAHDYGLQNDYNGLKTW